MLLSVVIPCHDEEGNVEPLYQALVAALDPSVELEMLFVDDGSRDATLERVRALRARDPRVRYIRLMTNYGHQIALVAGLRHARGDLVATLDADLQHPPRYLPMMIAALESSGAHVVIARRITRQRGLVKHHLSRLFYHLFRSATGLRIIEGASDFRLCTRLAVDVICGVDERHPFLRASVPSLRLPTAVIEYQADTRASGEPSYSVTTSLRLGLRALLRFSDLPVRAGLAVGSLGLLISVALAAHYLFLRLFTDRLVPGQADLMVFLGFISSVLILMLALLLDLAAQTHTYLRRQPLFLVAGTEEEDERGAADGVRRPEATSDGLTAAEPPGRGTSPDRREADPGSSRHGRSRLAGP